MKKFIITILLIGQIVWILHNGVITTMPEINNVNRLKNLEIRIGNGILKVVCVNFLETMKQIIELSCLVTNVVKKNLPNKNEQSQKVQLYFVNNVTNITSYANLKSNNNEYDESLMLILNNKIITTKLQLLFLWLLLIFIYLYRLRYFFLRARSSIESWCLVIRDMVIKNPNCFWEIRNSQEQLGFFIVLGITNTFFYNMYGVR